MEFDFQRYIQEHKRSGGSSSDADTGLKYAFSRDRRTMRTLELAKPVKMALAASRKLDTGTPKELGLEPVSSLSAERAEVVEKVLGEVCVKLQMLSPALYITHSAGDTPAGLRTLEDKAVLILDRKIAEEADEISLRFLLGTQCGHIQAGHALYLDAISSLADREDSFAQWVIKPAVMALDAWSRQGIITADRAGLLACGDLGAAVTAMVRGARGWSLGAPNDVDDLLDHEPEDEKPEDGPLLGLAEVDAYLPVRVLALRAFVDSRVYRELRGLSGGDSISSVDSRIFGIIKTW